MKKKENKHNLVKVAGIMVLITVLLTWLIPQGVYQGSSLNVTEITRVGLFDFFTYGLLGMYYFTVLVTFIFVLGAFYQVLSRTKGYQDLTSKIAEKFNGKEIIFVLCTSFVLAVITAITNEYIVVLSVVPFFITILSKMKLDKITAFVTTFGAILVGILGSVYSAKIVGINVQYLGTEYNALLWVKILTFALAYLAFNTFTVLHLFSAKNNKKNEAVADLFETKETNEKSRSASWAIAVVLGIFALVTLLAYLPWEEVFKVTWFSDALKSITEAKVFGSPVFGYILGKVNAFGSWDIFGVQIVMLISILIIKIVDKMSFDEVCEAFGEGFKKVSKLVVIMLLCYLVLEFAVMFPVIPTIVDWFLGLFGKASEKLVLVFSSITGLFTSMFTVEYQYTYSLIGTYLTNAHSAFTNQIAYMLQATYGLASMFSPASAILFVGLSYLGITYKEWMKYIWKFLLVMLVVIIVLMIIIC